MTALSLFAGRVAVVTGGGCGLGRDSALELARRGAAVAVDSSGDSSARQRPTLGDRAEAMSAPFVTPLTGHAVPGSLLEEVEAVAGWRGPA